jgi:hypothetical protein
MKRTRCCFCTPFPQGASLLGRHLVSYVYGSLR